MTLSKRIRLTMLNSGVIMDKETIMSLLKFGEALTMEMVEKAPMSSVMSLEDTLAHATLLLVKDTYKECSPFIDDERMGELVVESGLSPEVFTENFMNE